MTDNLANFSAFLDAKIRERMSGMTREQLEDELLLMHRTIKVVEEVGEVVQVLIGLTGANPRKGVEATTDDLLKEFQDVAVSVLGAGEHVKGNEGTMLRDLDDRISAVTERAGLVDAQQECDAEMRSWDYFSPNAVDNYYMRCDLLGQHDEHENQETGAKWKTEVGA